MTLCEKFGWTPEQIMCMDQTEISCYFAMTDIEATKKETVAEIAKAHDSL